MLAQARLPAAVVILGVDAFIKQIFAGFVQLLLHERKVGKHPKHNVALVLWYRVFGKALKLAQLAVNPRLRGGGLALRLTLGNFARNLRTIAYFFFLHKTTPL